MMKMLYPTLLSLLIASASAQGPVAAISSASSSQCLDVRGSKFKDGTAVQTLDCNNSTAQQWEIFSGLTEVRVADPELEVKFCLDAIDVDSSNKVKIWECNQNPQQQWIYTDDGLLTLANNTNLCLDVPESSTKNGVQVQTYPCNGGLNQVWNLV